jgi:hypothetical protein
MSAFETNTMSERESPHLDPGRIAAYVARTVDPEESILTETHLMMCAECREEVADARRIVALVSRHRLIPRWAPPVAAAAILLLVFLPNVRTPSSENHREAPVTATVAPTALEPRGALRSLPVLRWTSVPRVDAYEVRVYSSDGSVLWEGDTRDTLLAIPSSAGLRPGPTYFWKVEALTGFDRRVASALTEFSIRPLP